MMFNEKSDTCMYRIPHKFFYFQRKKYSDSEIDLYDSALIWCLCSQAGKEWLHLSLNLISI